MAVFGLLVTAGGALAQAPDTVFLEELTWTEVRDAIRAGKTTIIVPAGGTEQNGPHMALGKHNARVKILSQDIARALGDALVAPVIAYVPEGGIAPPTAHMRYPGTITVPEEAFQKVLEFAARSFKLHGFRNIVLLGDHGPARRWRGSGRRPPRRPRARAAGDPGGPCARRWPASARCR